MYMTKVSVIVPVYNVSNYIERCARSLFEQTMTDIEFIFVDDCSSDNSIEIVKSVLKDYPSRIDSVIFCNHETNKGLPTARKTGVEISHGKYIAHCDSDDWIEHDMYETLYDIAERNDSDIVISDYFVSDGFKNNIIKVSDYHGGLLQGPVWNKIVKHDLYYKIKFPIANKAEDGAIMTQLSFFAQNVMVYHRPLYYYFKNPYSICHLPSREACINRWKQECDNTDFRIKFLKEFIQTEKYRTDIILMKYYSLTNLIPYISDKYVYKLWKSKYSEINKEMKYNFDIPFRIKVSYFLMKYQLVWILRYFRK